MNFTLSTKEIAVGVLGTVLGGVFVWLLTKNLELSAQSKALELVTPQVAAAMATSKTAEEASESAIKRANEAIKQANEALKNVKDIENQANESLIKLKTLPAYTNNDQTVDQIREAVNQIANAEITALREQYESFINQFDADIAWPHALNCGIEWDAIYILHGSPRKDGGGEAWYVQVYPDEYRYVKFDSNGNFTSRGGHSLSSEGCRGKTIEKLKNEKRAFKFLTL